MRTSEVIQQAREVAAELTGRPVENVTGFERNGDGWVVTLEVLELERVPNTMDVIGSYEITLSDKGEVKAFNRRRRYPRAASEGND
ncbi:MAG: hypothetical protein QOE86_2141 [Solirubrobacteraceae bacterium]|jgi:hypothetical protein|nr:hypothetical protein [Solirubrobacteraceae bacterium]